MAGTYALGLGAMLPDGALSRHASPARGDPLKIASGPPASQFLRGWPISNATVELSSDMSSIREGGKDASSRFGNSGGRNDVRRWARGCPNLLAGLSGLPARVRPGHLLRMPLHIAGTVQRFSVWASGSVCAQPLRGERGTSTGATLPAIPAGLLS